MASREIPGYYYDAERRRYFRVESSQTAPSNAAWSSEKVKKRKLEDKAAAAELRWESLNKNRITRSEALNVPLMGGFLAREYGQHIHDLRDLRTASFAQGIIAKGIRPLNQYIRAATNIKHMAIVSKHPEHPVCTAYIDVTNELVWSIPIPRDETGSYDRRTFYGGCSDTPLGCLCPQPEEWMDQTSDIKYSKKAGLVLVSSRDPDTQGALLSTFAPTRLTCRTYMQNNGRIQEYGDVDNRKYTCNTICLAPSTSNQICLIGTNMGVAHFNSNSQMKLYTSPTWGSKSFVPNSFRDVFAIDYHASNPDIMFFGGRPGALFIGDLRQEVDRWNSVKLKNSISHIKTVSEHQVIVAGLRNTLSVFDLRYCDLSQVRGEDNPKVERTAKPVVIMPSYKNAARFDVGLDYDPDSGVIAAAHDDGKVALYSVRSGNRLPSRDVDNIYSKYGPIHQLRFEAFDGDDTPTLFVGERNHIGIYSFGVDDPDDEA
ncbi:hypothetical protein F4776DRAFT_630198 [Hypoxylon sp. NC0597]|nr:hypothetical protein F4776DRAFT_630198 [Hypoxylon sp. NC0597]